MINPPTACLTRVRFSQQKLFEVSFLFLVLRHFSNKKINTVPYTFVHQRFSFDFKTVQYYSLNNTRYIDGFLLAAQLPVFYRITQTVKTIKTSVHGKKTTVIFTVTVRLSPYTRL
jgi:hypothetical protein